MLFYHTCSYNEINFNRGNLKLNIISKTKCHCPLIVVCLNDWILSTRLIGCVISFYKN